MSFIKRFPILKPLFMKSIYIDIFHARAACPVRTRIAQLIPAVHYNYVIAHIFPAFSMAIRRRESPFPQRNPYTTAFCPAKFYPKKYKYCYQVRNKRFLSDSCFFLPGIFFSSGYSFLILHFSGKRRILLEYLRLPESCGE